MPACFNLTRKGEVEPANLQLIDDELWTKLGCTKPDSKCWYRGWFNTVGFALACGRSLHEVRETLKQQCEDLEDDNELAHYKELIQVCKYLEDNFEPRSWHER